LRGQYLVGYGPALRADGREESPPHFPLLVQSVWEKHESRKSGLCKSRKQPVAPNCLSLVGGANGVTCGAKAADCTSIDRRILEFAVSIAFQSSQKYHYHLKEKQNAVWQCRPDDRDEQPSPFRMK
jgi:hypothetical protein